MNSPPDILPYSPAFKHQLSSLSDEIFGKNYLSAQDIEKLTQSDKTGLDSHTGWEIAGIQYSATNQIQRIIP
jgi:hypothetical protein